MVVSIIVLKLVPAFSDFYASFDARAAAGHAHHRRGSNVLATTSCWCSLAVASAALALVVLGATAGRAARMDRALLRLPWAGDVARKFATAQLARTLATLLGGGIPLVNALEIAGRSIGNRLHGARAREVAQSVREGQGLAATCERQACFPMWP